MAVLIEAISIVIRLETIADKYPGGVDQYVRDCPNGTLCMDEEITRVGFMCGADAGDFIDSLENLGFRFVTDDQYDEIAVVDQFEGFYKPCDWLDFLNLLLFDGNIRVKICRVKGKPLGNISFPYGWNYEKSLSKRTDVIDNKEFGKRMIFLRHEVGVDFYLDTVTGEERWIQRTVSRNLNS